MKDRAAWHPESDSRRYRTLLSLPFPPFLYVSHLRREQASYQLAAIAATSGVLTLAIVATYLRFQWHHDEDIPWEEVVGTLALVAGGVVSQPQTRGAFLCSDAPRSIPASPWPLQHHTTASTAL